MFQVKMNTKLPMLLLSLVIVNISVVTKVKTTKATIFDVLLRLYKPYMLKSDFDKLGNMLAIKVLPILRED